MKHKRQTLGKQGEDGDDKDSITSDGGKSSKLTSEKFLDDEISKKSCQGCELPSTGLCNAHDEVPDIGATRINNNNTPSATNNNASFNNNSNGASSVASSGSFEKVLTEEDSRSNEDSGLHHSPRGGKKGSNMSGATSNLVTVKLESRRNSPNAAERKVGIGKMSPNICQKDQNLLLSSNAEPKLNVKNMPQSNVPGAPILHSSPVPMTSGNSMVYPPLQR